MDEKALLEHARIGISEAVARYAILIDVSYTSSKSPSWGMHSQMDKKQLIH